MSSKRGMPRRVADLAREPVIPIGVRIIQEYRVLVTARPGSRPRDFIWQIVRGTGVERLAVKAASTVTLKSMSEAYAAGAAELSRLTPS
jgi:hypothetical protein